jgi:hypothetical protein
LSACRAVSPSICQPGLLHFLLSSYPFVSHSFWHPILLSAGSSGNRTFIW